MGSSRGMLKRSAVQCSAVPPVEDILSHPDTPTPWHPETLPPWELLHTSQRSLLPSRTPLVLMARLVLWYFGILVLLCCTVRTVRTVYLVARPRGDDLRFPSHLASTGECPAGEEEYCSVKVSINLILPVMMLYGPRLFLFVFRNSPDFAKG